MRAAKLAGAANALKLKSGRAASHAPFNLAFMTDAKRVPNPVLVARALPSGAAVILRDYDMPGRDALAMQLAQVCKARGLLLLIGADPALARRVGAKGLHMPTWFRARNDHSTPRFNDLVVSAACHDDAELRAAEKSGADIAMLSPAFPTASHPNTLALGPQRFRRIAAASRLPVLALGGVDETNAAQLSGPNVVGFAAIGAFVEP